MIRILYVDDEPAILEIGKTLLEADTEFQVDTTTSASEALSFLSSRIYDLVIADYLMPEMNGLEFLFRVRAIHQTIPFIFFTGQATQSMVIEAVNRGADFFLEKDQDPAVSFLELSQLIRLGYRRHQSERLLAESEKKYRQIIELAAEGVWVIDEEAKTTFVNPRMAAMLGYTEEEMVGRPLYAFMDDQGRIIADENIARRKQGVSEQHDFEFIRKDGSRIYTSIETSPLTDEDGRYAGALGLIADITRRRQDEERLRFVNAVLSTLKETTVEGILVVDADDQIITVNKRFIEMWKIPPDVIMTGSAGKALESVLDLVVDPDEFVTRIGYLYGHPDEESREEVFLKDGTVFDRYSAPMISQEGTLYGRVWYYQDITNLKKNEAAIIRLSSENQVILDNMPAMIWYKDTANRIIRINPAAARAVGRQIWEIEGKDAGEIFPDLAEQYFKDDLEVIRSGEPKLGIIEEMTIPGGNNRWLETDKLPLRDENGEIVGVLVFSVDITDRRYAEQAIRLANKKLHLLSDITRHDILNQIQGLLFFVDEARSETHDSAVQETINKIAGAVNNIQRQITFTRDYQDLGVKSPAWQDVRLTIALAIKPLPLTPVVAVIDIDGVQVYADPLLGRVYYNLAENARRYGEKVTTIRFSASESPDGLVIACEDDGVGIPPEKKEGIFTRKYFLNTGFGLNLSREILSITDLSIRETGTLGEGARFEILVPPGKYRYLPPE